MPGRGPVRGWSTPDPDREPQRPHDHDEAEAEASGPGHGWDDDEEVRPGDEGDAGGFHPHADDEGEHEDAPPAPGRHIRLQKVLAGAGIASRRACEQLIEDGEVRVNGQVVDRLPCFVDPVTDKIEVRERRLRFQEKPLHVMLFKPRGVLSTNDETDGRRRALDLVRHPSRARLFAVGRLDVDSSGLLLLTTDGELANRLTHPRYGVHKTYEVTVEGRIEPNELARLERGVFLQDRHTSHGQTPGRKTSQSRLEIVRASRDRTRLLMELGEGRNRQIRRMMLYVGHKVRKLRRVALGPLRLKGLRVGEWRELTHQEARSLYRAAEAGEKAWRRREAERAERGPGRGRKTGPKRSGGVDRPAGRGPGRGRGKASGPGRPDREV